MNEIEAKRIAAVIGILRPDWREGLVMSVLGDERIRHRVYEDILVAAVACYSDPTTGKPGRLHEPGRWWLTVTAQAPTATYREITGADCAICSRPARMHSALSKVDPHEWEPQNVRGRGAKPTPEQRAAMDKAAAEARDAATATREKAEAEKSLYTQPTPAREEATNDDEEMSA